MEVKRAMEIICQDFSVFCNYLLEKKVKITKTTGHIGKKDCFELNKLFHVNESYEKATRFQNQYPVIHFFYYAALKYRILEIDYTKRVFRQGKNYKAVEQSSELEKCILLMVTALHDMCFIENDPYCRIYVRQLIWWLLENQVVTGGEYQLPINTFGWLAVDRIKIVSILEELCLIKILENPLDEKGFCHGELKIKVLPLFEMVAELYDSISEEEAVFWNMDIENCLKYYLEFFIPQYQESNIFCLLQPSTIKNSCQAVDLEVTIRYTDVVRVIRMNMSDSLYSLHRMIQKAVQFDDDHLFEFHVGQGMLRETYTISEAVTSGNEKDVEDTTLGELELYKGMKFSYLFDFGDMWWFDIKVLDILDTTVAEPVVVREENPAPQQYAYPDDEEFW